MKSNIELLHTMHAWKIFNAYATLFKIFNEYVTSSTITRFYADLEIKVYYTHQTLTNV